MTTRPIFPWIAIPLLAGIYFGAGKFGLSLAFANENVSPVWPPTGIALAVLLLYGVRLWPGIFLGAFLVNLTTQWSVLTGLSIAAGNTVEALLAAWLVNRFAQGANAFERAGSIFRFVALAALLSTTASATIGVVSLCLGGHATWHQFWPIWLTWWLGDSVSNFVIAPLLLIWACKPPLRFRPEQAFEAVALVMTAGSIGGIIFFSKKLLYTPMEYLTIPPLLWAAFRFGRQGAVTAAFLVSAIALWGTLNGRGPFATGDANKSLLLLQAFMATVTLTVLVLASVAEERKHAILRLEIQEGVSRVLANSPTLEEAIPLVLKTVCQSTEWEIGVVWRVNDNLKELSCIDLWKEPVGSYTEFETMTRQLRFTRGVGLPGRVWSSGKPAWIVDLSQDTNFPRIKAAADEGLRSGYSFPLTLGEEILGVIECFSREMRKPDENFLQMMTEIGAQIGQFIERNRAEEALREGEDELRRALDFDEAVVSNMGEGLYTVDSKGLVTFLNPAAEKLFGWSLAELRGRKMHDMTHYKHSDGSPFPAEECAGLQVLREGRELSNFEDVFIRKDGTFFHVVYSSSPLREGGEITGLVVVFRDISDRKRAEAELAKAQNELRKHATQLEATVAERTVQLRATISELESFSYSLSHDMRAPLRAIHGFSHIVLQEHAKNLKPEAKDLLQRVVSAADRMDRLIVDVLSFARVSRQQMKAEAVDVEKLLREIIQERPEMQPPRARIEIQSPLYPVNGHEASLTQCLTNLLGNAVKFVAPGIQPHVRIWSEQHADKVRLCIEDNGIGIKKEVQPQLFQMFQRLAGDHRTYEGNGIGLAIVRKAVERMKGEVGVDSEDRKGSRFWLQLPAAGNGKMGS